MAIPPKKQGPLVTFERGKEVIQNDIYSVTFYTRNSLKHISCIDNRIEIKYMLKPAGAHLVRFRLESIAHTTEYFQLYVTNATVTTAYLYKTVTNLSLSHVMTSQMSIRVIGHGCRSLNIDLDVYEICNQFYWLM